MAHVAAAHGSNMEETKMKHVETADRDLAMGSGPFA
jgi:hypothetical protein